MSQFVGIKLHIIFSYYPLKLDKVSGGVCFFIFGTSDLCFISIFDLTKRLSGLTVILKTYGLVWLIFSVVCMFSTSLTPALYYSLPSTLGLVCSALCDFLR